MVVVMLRHLLMYFERMLAFCQNDMVRKVPLGDGFVQTPLMPESDLGHLVPMHCGHRGKPSRHEERMLDALIRDSGFLDMLDQTSE